MFNSMIRRTMFVLSAVAPLTIASRAASGQGRVIIRGDRAMIGPSANSLIQRVLPISDDTVRSLIERYEPSVLTDDAEANVVTIVLDNSGNYLRSTSRHAKVIQAQPGQVISLSGGSVRALVLPDSTDGEVVQRIAAGGVAVGTLRRAELGEPRTILGTGYTMDEVEAISTKRYEAGSLTKSQLIVTVVRLK